MFSLEGVGDEEPVHGEGVDVLPVVGELLTAFRGVAEKLCFLWDHCDVMKVSILQSKGEQPAELVGAAAHQGNVISLAYTRNMCGPKLYSKVGALGQSEFSIVGKFVEPVAEDSTLLNTQKIVNRSHEAFFPLDKSFSIFEPVVEKNKTLTRATSQKCSPDAYFSQDFVESTLGVEEKDKNRRFTN